MKRNFYIFMLLSFWMAIGANSLGAKNPFTVIAPAQNALHFDGVNDLVSCGTSSTNLMGDLTIEFWLYNSGAMDGATVISKSYLGEFEITFWGNELNFYQGKSGGTFESFTTGATVTAATPSWNYFTVVRNATAKTIATYKNGVKISTVSYTSTLISSANALTLGSRPGGGLNMHGSLDEVRIWHAVRTDTEVANHHSCQLVGNETNLLTYYKFDQGIAAGSNTSVTSLTDATSNARTGTLTNFALTGATSNWITSTATTTVTPSVSIAASPSGAINAGTSVTFTATPTHGGATPTYVWKKGGVPISGQTAATYTSTTLANGDVITCDMTSNVACASPTTATSTGITMTVTGSYTWTGTTSTNWATATNWNPNGIPTSTDNIIIPTTANKPMLPANQTIANLSLTGTNKIMLGNHNLCVNAITGGNATSFVVTNGTGGLLIKGVSTTATIFPVGPSETAYTPATITNNVARDFTVKVGTTLTNAAALTKTVNLQWDITPSVLTGNSATLALGWSTANQNSAFNPNAAVEIAHYNTSSSIWDRFRLATVTGSNPYVATVSGVDAFSPFVVANQNALSVELLDFKATPQYNGNLLTWTTASEVNNKGFYVETQTSSRFQTSTTLTANEWVTLGFVKSTSSRLQTSTTLTAYDFTDTQTSARLQTSTTLNTIAYYRLRQIDNDGKETLSKVISISTKGNNKLKVYPNPVSNVLTVERNAVPFTNDDVQILNLLGQQVMNHAAVPTSSRLQTLTTLIDVSALPQGTYFLKVGTEQVKFVKQ